MELGMAEQPTPESPALTIYTIGHSDHTRPAFVDLLRKFDVALLVDVRSQPYSRWTPQFNREDLAHDLEEAGIAYRSMGDSLGGRPADPVRRPGSLPAIR